MGGIKVIKSLGSVTIVLPGLAPSKLGSQTGHLPSWMFSLTQLLWNFLGLLELELSIRFLRFHVRYVLLYLDVTSGAL